MFTDSVDQAFGQGTDRMASLCSTVSEAGKLKGWELDYRKAHSFICLAVVGCWLGKLQFLSTCVCPCDLSKWTNLGFFRRCLGSSEYACQKESQKERYSSYYIALEIPEQHFYPSLLIKDKKSHVHLGSGEKNGLYLLMGRSKVLEEHVESEICLRTFLEIQFTTIISLNLINNYTYMHLIYMPVIPSTLQILIYLVHNSLT